jgi:hypothetical protein
MLMVLSITAGEMEYDGNTQKGVARKMLFLPILNRPLKQMFCIMTDWRVRPILIQGEPLPTVRNVMYTKSATYFLIPK